MNTLEKKWAEFPQKILSVCGVDISYREAGSGAPVVLLHGIGSGSGSWLFQFQALRERCRLVAWDAPGYGASTPLAEAVPGVLDYAEALWRLTDRIVPDPFCLVGHSLGALVAAAYCHRFPDNVDSMVLVNPAVGYAKDLPKERIEKNAARKELMERLGPKGLARERGKRLLSDSASAPALELVRWNMARVHKKGYLQAADMLANSDLCVFSEDIEVPVLVLCGTADQITPEKSAIRVASHYKRSRYIALKGLGHASYIEGAGVFNQHLSAFVATRQNRQTGAQGVS